MQFDYQHKAGQGFVKVIFIAELFSNTKFKQTVIDQMTLLFNRIGGVIQEDYSWHFPIFVSSNLLKEIIHNTCFVCGSLMKDSTALQNSLVSSDDFGSDAGSIGTTQSRSGIANRIKVRKCTQCGHSHT